MVSHSLYQKEILKKFIETNFLKKKQNQLVEVMGVDLDSVSQIRKKVDHYTSAHKVHYDLFSPDT